MALSKHHATILLDNNDPSLIYGPGWTSVDEATDIGGVTAWASNSNNTYVACSFQGTAISFTGNTEGHWSNLTATIDNGTPTTSSVLEADPTQFYMAWYNSPILADGNHTVNLTGLTGVALDYVTVEAGLNTPLVGSTLIVDDNDTSVAYAGSWIQSPQSYSKYTQHDSTCVMPYLNTTHYSNTAGDTASLAFTGTSVSVYGVVSWSLIGNVSISFTLDSTLKSTYHLISNGTDPQGTYYDHTGFQFFTTLLQAGDHVLEVNVTENAGNQFFILDYFLYQPSFSTLATMPNLTLSSATTISPGSQHAKSSAKTGAHVSTIVVGVILGCLALFLLGVFLYRRRSRIAYTEIGSKPPIDDIFHTEPFVLTQSSSVAVPPGEPHYPSTAPSNPDFNSLAAENEALRTRILKFEGTGTQEAGQSSSSSPNMNRVVQMQRQMEEKVRIQQELSEPPPSYE